MINKKIARRYSLALYETASELKLADRVRKDLLLIQKILEDSKDLMLLARSPIINSEKKIKIFELLFSKKIHSITLKFIKLLTEKNREIFLYDICQDYRALLNEENGIAEADIRTTINLNYKEKKQITAKLKSYTGKNISANFTVDPAIKGGFVARIDDTIIDASISRQLDLLYQQLKEGGYSG